MNEGMSLVDNATKVAAMLKEQNDRFEANLARGEEIAARMALGGKSGAGTPPEKKEETPQEYKERVLKGLVR